MWASSYELFKSLDDQSGGVVERTKRYLKLKVRMSWFRHELAQLATYMEKQQLSYLLKSDPSIYLKSTRSYLWTGLKGPQRLNAQLAYFDWLIAKSSTEYVRHFLGMQSVEVCKMVIGNDVIEIHLSPARGYAREGELMLGLSLNGCELIKASFTVLPSNFLDLASPGHAMFIGCIQGRKDSKDLLKEATQVMERTKPSAILFNALQSVATAWGLVGIVGVSSDTHAFAGYQRSLSKRIQSNYDDVWQELGAQTQTKLKHWVLPLTWHPRSELQVPSKKRSALRKRNLFRQTLMDSCTEAASCLITDSTYSPSTLGK